MQRSAPSRRLEVEPRKVAPPKSAETQPHPPSSPESICVICLDRIEDKSYLNNCLHPFCFTCVLKWSEVKMECPLCKQKFESALYNVRSDKDYDLYTFNTADVEKSPSGIVEFEQALIPELQIESEENTSYVPTHIIMVDFRRYVYEHRLTSMPLCGTHHIAACTPQYIRSHQQDVRVRLIPWLNRELGVVISVGYTHLAIAIERVLSVSAEWHILSPEFRERIAFCTSDKTDLFCWELYNFTSSFCSMIQFDEEVRYVIPNSLDVPLEFRQFCASLGTTNPIVSSVDPSLGLSLTVQSPARSLPSPVLSSTSDLDTDSGFDVDINLILRTLRRRQGGGGGVRLNSSRHERPSREQVARPAELHTPLGRWSSDTSDCDSADTHVARMRHRRKKLRKIKNSKKDLQHKLVKTLKSAERKKNNTNKGDKSNVAEGNARGATASRLDGAGSSNPNARGSQGAARGRHVPSRDQTGRSVPSSSVRARNDSFRRSKRTWRASDSSSEDSGVSDALSAYRKRSTARAPVSYYHGGFVPITGERETTYYTSRIEHHENKRRLSSVIVRPATNSRPKPVVNENNA